MKKSIVILLMLLFSLKASHGNNDSINNDLIKNPVIAQVQYAGNMGIVSIGIGKHFFKENLSVCIIYGYLPKKINGVEVHTLALKTSVNYLNINLKHKSRLSGYIGGSLLRGFTHNTFVKYPDYYPDGYYEPNAHHFAIFTGAKHSKLIKKSKIIDCLSVFAEIGTLDYMLWYGYKNDFIGIRDIWNVSFGIYMRINKSKR